MPSRRTKSSNSRATPYDMNNIRILTMGIVNNFKQSWLSGTLLLQPIILKLNWANLPETEVIQTTRNTNACIIITTDTET